MNCCNYKHILHVGQKKHGLGQSKRVHLHRRPLELSMEILNVVSLEPKQFLLMIMSTAKVRVELKRQEKCVSRVNLI